MTYVAWAALYEGKADASYFNILIPRLMEDMVMAGSRSSIIPTDPAIIFGRASPEDAAKLACDAKDAFHLIFIHADTGGRALQVGLPQRSGAYCDAMRIRCNWSMDRCIIIAPNHETEAWILADPQAITSTLGYSGNPGSIGLPANAVAAERLVDPKLTLKNAFVQVRGRGPISSSQIFPAIAQRQRFSELRRSTSFCLFERSLAAALHDLGCI